MKRRAIFRREAPWLLLLLLLLLLIWNPVGGFVGRQIRYANLNRLQNHDDNNFEEQNANMALLPRRNDARLWANLENKNSENGAASSRLSRGEPTIIISEVDTNQLQQPRNNNSNKGRLASSSPLTSSFGGILAAGVAALAGGRALLEQRKQKQNENIQGTTSAKSRAQKDRILKKLAQERMAEQEEKRKQQKNAIGPLFTVGLAGTILYLGTTDDVPIIAQPPPVVVAEQVTVAPAAQENNNVAATKSMIAPDSAIAEDKLVAAMAAHATNPDGSSTATKSEAKIPIAIHDSNSKTSPPIITTESASLIPKTGEGGQVADRDDDAPQLKNTESTPVAPKKDTHAKSHSKKEKDVEAPVAVADTDQTRSVSGVNENKKVPSEVINVDEGGQTMSPEDKEPAAAKKPHAKSHSSKKIVDAPVEEVDSNLAPGDSSNLGDSDESKKVLSDSDPKLSPDAKDSVDHDKPSSMFPWTKAKDDSVDDTTKSDDSAPSTSVQEADNSKGDTKAQEAKGSPPSSAKPEVSTEAASSSRTKEVSIPKSEDSAQIATTSKDDGMKTPTDSQKELNGDPEKAAPDTTSAAGDLKAAILSTSEKLLGNNPLLPKESDGAVAKQEATKPEKATEADNQRQTAEAPDTKTNDSPLTEKLEEAKNGLSDLLAEFSEEASQKMLPLFDGAKKGHSDETATILETESKNEEKTDNGVSSDGDVSKLKEGAVSSKGNKHTPSAQTQDSLIPPSPDETNSKNTGPGEQEGVPDSATDEASNNGPEREIPLLSLFSHQKNKASDRLGTELAFVSDFDDTAIDSDGQLPSEIVEVPDSGGVKDKSSTSLVNALEEEYAKPTIQPEAVSEATGSKGGLAAEDDKIVPSKSSSAAEKSGGKLDVTPERLDSPPSLPDEKSVASSGPSSPVETPRDSSSREAASSEIAKKGDRSAADLIDAAAPVSVKDSDSEKEAAKNGDEKAPDSIDAISVKSILGETRVGKEGDKNAPDLNDKVAVVKVDVIEQDASPKGKPENTAENPPQRHSVLSLPTFQQLGIPEKLTENAVSPKTAESRITNDVDPALETGEARDQIPSEKRFSSHGTEESSSALSGGTKGTTDSSTADPQLSSNDGKVFRIFGRLKQSMPALPKNFEVKPIDTDKTETPSFAHLPKLAMPLGESDKIADLPKLKLPSLPKIDLQDVKSSKFSLGFGSDLPMTNLKLPEFSTSSLPKIDLQGVKPPKLPLNLGSESPLNNLKIPELSTILPDFSKVAVPGDLDKKLPDAFSTLPAIDIPKFEGAKIDISGVLDSMQSSTSGLVPDGVKVQTREIAFTGVALVTAGILREAFILFKKDSETMKKADTQKQYGRSPTLNIPDPRDARGSDQQPQPRSLDGINGSRPNGTSESAITKAGKVSTGNTSKMPPDPIGTDNSVRSQDAPIVDFVKEAVDSQAVAKQKAAEKLKLLEAEQKAAAEAAARMRLEVEKKKVEEKAFQAQKREESKRLEAERKAAAEVAARLKAEAERNAALDETKKLRQLQETRRREAETKEAEETAAREKAEQDEARLKAEEVRRFEAEREVAAERAARVRAEQEIARVKAEEEAKRQNAERKAATEEAIRVQLEAQKIAAEAEAVQLKEKGERQRQEAEKRADRETIAKEAAERKATELEAARFDAEQRAITEEAARVAAETERRAFQEAANKAKLTKEAASGKAPTAADDEDPKVPTRTGKSSVKKSKKEKSSSVQSKPSVADKLNKDEKQPLAASASKPKPPVTRAPFFSDDNRTDSIGRNSAYDKAAVLQSKRTSKPMAKANSAAMNTKSATTKAVKIQPKADALKASDKDDNSGKDNSYDKAAEVQSKRSSIPSTGKGTASTKPKSEAQKVNQKASDKDGATNDQEDRDFAYDKAAEVQLKRTKANDGPTNTKPKSRKSAKVSRKKEDKLKESNKDEKE